MAQFLVIWGDQFFTPALHWTQGNIDKGFEASLVGSSNHHGFRAPEMPAKVREWASQIQSISDPTNGLFSSTDYKMDDELIEGFGKEALNWLHIKFGQWLQPPLCFAELLDLNTSNPVQVAKRLLSKMKERPNEMDEDLWDAILQLVSEDVTDYEWADIHNGLNLRTALETIYLPIGIHNVDPEREFSIIHHKLKRAPNSSVNALSADLQSVGQLSSSFVRRIMSVFGP